MMKTFFLATTSLICALGLMSSMTACEVSSCDDNDEPENAERFEESRDGECVQFKSLTKFLGDEVDDEIAWAPGETIDIRGVNGSITVLEGEDEGAVLVTFEPFVFRAYDTPDDVVADNLADLNATVEGVDGAVEVRTSRDSGARTTLGADITVWLPTDFDGALVIRQNNGSTVVEDAVGAVEVDVLSDNGSCDIATGAAEAIRVNCDNGSLEASISDVPAGTSGRDFSTGNGDIELSFPSGAVFSVQALAEDGGEVDVGNAEDAGCTVDEASEASKTVVCNGATSEDPVYTATASGTSLADVVLSF